MLTDSELKEMEKSWALAEKVELDLDKHEGCYRDAKMLFMQIKILSRALELATYAEEILEPEYWLEQAQKELSDGKK